MQLSDLSVPAAAELSASRQTSSAAISEFVRGKLIQSYRQSEGESMPGLSTSRHSRRQRRIREREYCRIQGKRLACLSFGKHFGYQVCVYRWSGDLRPATGVTGCRPRWLIIISVVITVVMIPRCRCFQMLLSVTWYRSCCC
ncbi:hypothetical protein RRG08_014154 [Elysia crispata]|uniref:Uncharacterized protein n=1 Tax=Elysia crispata TaxID=231223 RepID=A0AAE1AH42_9GAST|nr:hypothetical protein RRG08_014154 [Elysia crispata]